MVRKIVEKVPEKTIKEDLEKYRQFACELGADAKIITTDQIIFDVRTTLKCRYGMCPAYGTNVNCPPYVESLDEFREIVNRYRYAILLGIPVPSKGKTVSEFNEDMLKALRKMFEVTSKVEAKAFYDGYYLALGTAAGPCKRAFCIDVECAVLQKKPCKAGFIARGEGTGMDLYLTATKAGWDMYPSGHNAAPEDIPPQRRHLSVVLIY